MKFATLIVLSIAALSISTGCASLKPQQLDDQAQTIRTIAGLAGKGAEVDQLLKLAGIGNAGPVDPFAAAPIIYGPYLDGNGKEILLPITRASWKAPITSTIVPGAPAAQPTPPASQPEVTPTPAPETPASGSVLDALEEISKAKGKK